MCWHRRILKGGCHEIEVLTPVDQPWLVLLSERGEFGVGGHLSAIAWFAARKNGGESDERISIRFRRPEETY